VDYFLGAARQILDQKPNVLFKIVGDGPDRAGLEKLAASMGIADRVVFTGGRDDMPLVYSSLDIFALASVDEGLPMVALEAMASGLPVVATTVGALPKVVDSGVTGLLVPPRDATALARAILTLLESPYVRQEMGVRGKVAVQEYSSWRMTLKYLSLYGGLLSEAGAIRDTNGAKVKV
jgi:glycosyltransferase involved in cell wall biosynthesis